MHFLAPLMENRSLGAASFLLKLGACRALSSAQPGQFVMLRGDWGRDPLLPRAFSILRTEADGSCEILVKTVGRGTALLQQLQPGAQLAVLGPLGSAFSPTERGGDYLVAGGVGLAPLLWFAETRRGATPHHLIYGARSAGELVLLDRIRAAGCTVTLTSEDGSVPPGWTARKGRVTDALAELLPARTAGARVLTCGPNPMMRAVVELARREAVPALVSVEGEMACGIGACLGCAVPLVPGGGDSRPFGYACVDGPVFDAARIVIP
jgi:dihydroorotate dehydrogenase electron transfer subunit